MSSDNSDEWVALETVAGIIEANAHKAVLEGYGIPVTLRSDQLTNSVMRGINAGPLGEVSLLTPSNRLEEARALLSDLGMTPAPLSPAAQEERDREGRRAGKVAAAVGGAVALGILVKMWQELSR